MSGLDETLSQWVTERVGASAMTEQRSVQTLWGGYGEIVRCGLRGAAVPSVIVKRVQWPTARRHPRGWATDRGHARKVKSYAVEVAFYQRNAPDCGVSCRVPACLGTRSWEDGVLLVLEDLDAAGFDRRHETHLEARRACLSWLAHFHAAFMGPGGNGLWDEGTYWHLDTRPDELAAMPDGPLKDAAPRLAARLRDAPFSTLVHGDAKLANFCFGEGGVAAVDFQYVGRGNGMKDVAYFISSIVTERDAPAAVPGLLDHYFAQLRAAVPEHVDADALEASWRALYPVAWADFYRFLQGWSPGHPKMHRYSEGLVREVLETL